LSYTRQSQWNNNNCLASYSSKGGTASHAGFRGLSRAGLYCR